MNRNARAPSKQIYQSKSTANRNKFKSNASYGCMGMGANGPSENKSAARSGGGAHCWRRHSWSAKCQSETTSKQKKTKQAQVFGWWCGEVEMKFAKQIAAYRNRILPTFCCFAVRFLGAFVLLAVRHILTHTHTRASTNWHPHHLDCKCTDVW